MDRLNNRNLRRKPPFPEAEGPSSKRRENYPARLPEFEFGRLRIPDEETHRLLLKAGQGGSY